MASDDLANELEAFNAEFRQSLPERMSQIENLWSELKQGEVSPEHMHALLRGLHAIAGSAGTFGIPQLSAAAAAAETFIEPFCEGGTLSGESDRERFEALLGEVRRAAA